MPNLYASLAALKTQLGISDTTDDALLLRILEAVSRDIEVHCERRFYVETRTRYYTARRRYSLRVDDLLSVTSLSTDEDGDRTYEISWASTDYDLDPANALIESPPRPYRKLCVTPEGDYWFPRGMPRGVRLVGSWGFYQVLSRLTATASAIADTTGTSVTVSAGAEFSAGQTLLIDAEQLYVSAVSGTTLTVQRGVNGTTAATHGAASAIDLYTYPLVGEACLLQAALNYKAKDAPGGMGGSGEFQQPIVAGGLHPFTKRSLDPVKRVEVG